MRANTTPAALTKQPGKRRIIFFLPDSQMDQRRGSVGTKAEEEHENGAYGWHVVRRCGVAFHVTLVGAKRGARSGAVEARHTPDLIRGGGVSMAIGEKGC